MYNPEGVDNNKEYVELYSEISLNTSLLQFQDQYNEEPPFEVLQYSNSSYYLIVEEDFNYSTLNATILSAGSAIGYYGLGEEEIIIISYNSSITDTIHYYSEWGADNNGNSICKINNIWIECSPTPGKESIKAEEEYTIRINEFIPNPEGNDSATMPDGEWIELYNYGTETIDLTGLILKDNRGTEISITDTTTYDPIIEPETFIVVYMNKAFGFLNNDGFEKIELLSQSNQKIDEITYSDSKEGNSWSLIKDTWQITKPTPNQENLNEDKQKDSKITIKTIYLGSDNKAKFGDNLRVRIEIYKGDESKEEIKVFIEKDGEKITKTTAFKIEERYSENTITVPIQIFPNCNSKYEEGTYSITAIGLDTSDDEFIPIEGITKNLCGTIIETHIENPSKVSASNINGLETQDSIKVYESESEKSRRAALFFFCLTLILVILQLNLEKWRK